jgi:hypothetical protein
MFNINDLRGNLEGQKEKYLLQLAEDIIMWSCFWDHRPGMGEFIKKYGNKLNALGMGELKPHHFAIADWKIKKLLKIK